MWRPSDVTKLMSCGVTAWQQCQADLPMPMPAWLFRNGYAVAQLLRNGAQQLRFLSCAAVTPLLNCVTATAQLSNLLRH